MMASRDEIAKSMQRNVIPKPANMDSKSFMYLMADVLRLPEETLAMAFIYLHKYNRILETLQTKVDLDVHTISLASLSLASRGTEAPRRLREFLLPAYRILQVNDPSAQPLTFPSVLYDSLRATVVHAELILLRILKFELRIPLPYDFLPRYLERTVGELNVSRNGWGSTEDYDGLGKEYQAEYKVVDLMNTNVAKACRANILVACSNARLSNLYPARAITAACLFETYSELGMHTDINPSDWLREVTTEKVDIADFDEILSELRRIRSGSEN